MRHLPRGRCGLKFCNPLRRFRSLSHLPRGRCGLKLVAVIPVCAAVAGHLPRGRCGLKFGIALHTDILLPSPSARKVWIEMYMLVRSRWKNGVTFRKEGVDWNDSGRGEWSVDLVTFRKEGVDWNDLIKWYVEELFCHLPQGRCGLKLQNWREKRSESGHLPQGRCGLK